MQFYAKWRTSKDILKKMYAKLEKVLRTFLKILPHFMKKILGNLFSAPLFYLKQRPKKHILSQNIGVFLLVDVQNTLLLM